MLGIFILKIKYLEALPENHKVHQDILDRIDDFRREKLAAIANPKVKAASEGAALLLAFIENGHRTSGVMNVTVSDLIALTKPRNGNSSEIAYRINEHGKPYFEAERMPYFNISHSGDYVVLAVSDTEVGVDIQYIKSGREEEMSERFFSEQERKLVTMSNRFFYRLWARKEAYGKCEGIGVRPVLERDFSELEKWTDYKWVEKDIDEEYYLTVCKKN